MSHTDLIRLLLALAVLLGSARLLGEIARRLGQPSVLGEMLAGILLGPTVLGAWSPGAIEYLFAIRPDGVAIAGASVHVALQALTSIAIVLFLLVAGMEVDLSTMFRQGRTNLGVGIGSMLVPFLIGFALAWPFAADLGMGPLLSGERAGQTDGRLVFALFFATSLSISALPVIARTLMDLDMYRSDVGMTVIAAAVFNDLIGWIVFALVLGLAGVHGADHLGIGSIVALILGFSVFMLSAGRWLIDRTLPWIQAHLSWPGGVLGFAVTLTLLGAAFTEWIGIHAILGAFLVGVALGDSRHLRERTRVTIDQFVSFVFAPLFFASIGLKVNFAADFNLGLVLTVLVVACIGKISGAGLAARLLGMPWRQAWAVGLGLNARGAMEIILSILALGAGLINREMFVALVVMALVTSMIAGPLMQKVLQRRRPQRFCDFLGPRAFLPQLAATDRDAAVRELCAALNAQGLSSQAIADAVIAHSQAVPAALGDGLAIPHARLEGLSRTVVALGISRCGIDFDSPDGQPVHVVAVIVAPEYEPVTELEIYRDLVQTFRSAPLREQVLGVHSHTELLALLASERAGGPPRSAGTHGAAALKS